jgi:hypothetical protein
MTGITLIPSNGFDQITEINCGTSSPKLGGSIDLSSFPNLVTFICTNNDIITITNYDNKPNLRTIRFFDNKIIGSILNLDNNIQLRDFRCYNNLLTGSIPSIINNTQLRNFHCYLNQLTGSIPSLSANTQLIGFFCWGNQLTGSIPNISINTQLTEFFCYSNQLTGVIPSLSANTQLVGFRCQSNQLTGFAGGSVSITLGNFQAQTNQLPATAVNDILAAFVAANRITGTRVLNLGGTGNAAPTGQGLTDKQTLINRGWTVTTN